MSLHRGVTIHYAVAPRPVTAPAVQGVARRGVQYIRQFLIAALVTAALMLQPPAASAAFELSQPAVQAHPQSYAAWSCRGVYHVVRRGETLYSIARRYGTTAYRIAVCNGLAAYTVYVGQTLLVPMAR